jgi:glutathione S-transferase
VITLKYKQAPFEITYIDLESPPEWFDRISPLGKVPLLRVDDQTVLFESAVINEFIDETIGAPLHPREPLRRALERAWIEYGSELFMGQYQMFTAQDRSTLEEHKREFFADLARVESVVSQGPYFRGAQFSLVDTAYAPLFMRLLLSDELKSAPEWKKMPRVRRWADSLLAVPAVRESVIPEFESKFRLFSRERGSLLF